MYDYIQYIATDAFINNSATIKIMSSFVYFADNGSR